MYPGGGSRSQRGAAGEWSAKLCMQCCPRVPVCAACATGSITRTRCVPRGVREHWLWLLQVDDLVMAQNEALRPEATAVAQQLRRAGRRVDLVLEEKKMKWAFKVRAGVMGFVVPGGVA